MCFTLSVAASIQIQSFAEAISLGLQLGLVLLVVTGVRLSGLDVVYYLLAKARQWLWPGFEDCQAACWRPQEQQRL